MCHGSAASSRGAVSTTSDAREHGSTELLERPKLRGIRHLTHQEPDPHWILQPAVQPALSMLEKEGLILELPAVFPNHLGDVPELARRHPGLVLVIDHLAKPPLGTAQMEPWADLLRSAAEQPNVYAKISGLNTVAPIGRVERDRSRARDPRRDRRVWPGATRLRKRLAGGVAER